MAAVPVLGMNMERDLLLDSGLPVGQVPAEGAFEENQRETQLVPLGRSKGAWGRQWDGVFLFGWRGF